MDQGELIRAAQQGEREAFDELVRQTYVDTFTLAYRLTGNEEDARDVAQDAYLRAWRGIGRFRGEAQFSTWMYRITANAASTHTRRRRRQRTEADHRIGDVDALAIGETGADLDGGNGACLGALLDAQAKLAVVEKQAVARLQRR